MDKITHANVYGGPALAIQTVKDFTGLPINHYMEVDFEGFVKLVDIVGGVTVKLDRPINDKKGASSSGGVSNVTYIPAGKQTLNGQQALTFVRSRKFLDGDFTRIKHQQQFMIALLKKATVDQEPPEVADDRREGGRGHRHRHVRLRAARDGWGVPRGSSPKTSRPTPCPAGQDASDAAPT